MERVTGEWKELKEGTRDAIIESRDKRQRDQHKDLISRRVQVTHMDDNYNAKGRLYKRNGELGESPIV